MKQFCVKMKSELENKTDNKTIFFWNKGLFTS